jgi:hypothetical protein
MRLGLAVVASAAALSMLAAPADAQTAKKKRIALRNSDYTVSVTRDEDGRTHTRIIVQRRSYLDAGTNVQPGERGFTNYVYGPNYSVTGVIDNTAFSHRSPLPGPFDLPGPHNPAQFP